MIGHVLAGRYRLVRPLGSGAMGQVWLADDELLDRSVAIKTVIGVRRGDAGGSSARADLLRRISREARLAARLAHPHAVAVYDFVVEDATPYVVMEYVAGDTLADTIAARGSLPAARVGEIGATIADALAEAHELGIVHRDIKPGNVLIDRRGRAKVADFGIARVSDDGATATSGLVLGTPAYLAPEVARGEPATAASDVWSLGVTLYAALDGRSPFQADEDTPVAVLGRILSATHVTPPSQRGPVSDEVMKMLRTDPKERPTAQSCADNLALDRSARPSPVTDRVTDAERTAAARDDIGRRSTKPQDTWDYQPWPAPAPEFGDRRSGRATVLALAATAVALVIAVAVTVTILLTGRGQDPNPAAGVPSRPDATSPAGPTPMVSTVTVSRSGATFTRTATLSASPMQTLAAPEGRVYRYDGDSHVLRIAAPPGFVLDAASATASYRDYVYADPRDRTSQPYLRVGVGADTAADTIDDEYTSASDSLRRLYGDVTILDHRYQTYCGTESVDIEFTGTRYGGRRHAIERLWHSGGQTLIVQLNTPESEWSTWIPNWQSLIVRDCAGS